MRRPLALLVLAGCLVLATAPAAKATEWGTVDRGFFAADFWQAVRWSWTLIWHEPTRLESAQLEAGPCSDPVGREAPPGPSCPIPPSTVLVAASGDLDR